MREEKLDLTPVSFKDLSGWDNDRHSEAASALKASCIKIANKKDWRQICAELNKNAQYGDKEAKEFFEKWFLPYAAKNYESGLFTGYYEAELNGAWHRNGVYKIPLWQKPDDMVSAELGEFLPELKGKRLTGKVENGKFRPYDKRAAIAEGSLEGRAKPLLWVDDPIDAFFLEIQGSGRVRMQDGSYVRVGYAAQNGHGYTAIGKVLADEGELEKPVTMEKIRDWLKTHPDKAQNIMNRNPSAVFFRKNDGEPVGAQGVSLTPQRSLAVDPAFVPLGTPLWLDIEQPALRKLVVAQDTGGAIKGAIRGDLFWGYGKEAAIQAGAMQGKGTYYLLLPKNP